MTDFSQRWRQQLEESNNVPSAHPAPLLVTRPEAARILSISVTEIDDLRRAGTLLAKKHGAKVLIPLQELERYADSLPWEGEL